MSVISPTQALFENQKPTKLLAPCDHYAGSEKLMLKSLALQKQYGPQLDLTFDCEDGAKVGNEKTQAELIAAMLNASDEKMGRIGIRIHPYTHPAWQNDIRIILHESKRAPSYITLPKVNSIDEVNNVFAFVEACRLKAKHTQPISIALLIETHSALAQVQSLAALTYVETLNFGIMDFVSAHYGAIPDSAMTSPGQFEHPLISRAKSIISSAAHAFAKVPSHNVTTEIKDINVVKNDVIRARDEFAYTRMWSIHPNQIAPIIEAFTPNEKQTQLASEIIQLAIAENWGPVRYNDCLYDRASYRYYWSVLQRAYAAKVKLPESISIFFEGINN